MSTGLCDRIKLALARVVGIGRWGVASTVLLAAKTPAGGLCFVPCQGRRLSDAERGGHQRLRAAGYRVLLIRSDVELDLSLSPIRRRAAGRLAAALSAIEEPVRMSA